MKGTYARLRKYFFKLFLLDGANERYVHRPAVFESVVSANPRKLFVVTVAYNDAEMIALQHHALGKHLKDEYEYFVVDNSRDLKKSEAVKRYCLEHSVNYFRAPLENPGLDGSLHHGFALNWAYRNIIDRWKPAEFAFVDPDLFPMEDVRIGRYLEMGDSWGVLADEYSFRTLWRHRARIWIGLACYRRSRFEGAGNYPNFLPFWGVDTGGRIPIDRAALLKLPDVPHSVNSPMIEIAPGIKVYKYAAFVHFSGSWLESPEQLAKKRQWISNNL